MAKPERLDKILAAQGSLSRKDVKALVARGAVTVNGSVVRRPETKIDPDADRVSVEGRELTLCLHAYLLLHKPQGVVSATRDASDRTVLDLVPPELWRKGLFPAGRLDKDTTGMVILTDDGDFAHHILSPKNHIPKTYVATLDKPITPQMEAAFAKGIPLKDGDCLPALLEPQPDGSARVTICEGMYHQIKRMFGVCGAKVLTLHRVRMGALDLDPTLPSGACRPLTGRELELLQQRPQTQQSDCK